MSVYSLYKPLIKPVLFSMDAEEAHAMGISFGKWCQNTPLLAMFSQSVPARRTEFMGLSFDHPVGMAAGLDKNGDAIDFFGAMGFSHLELGTVTPRPQPGNDRPRLFRVVDAEGIINRMGFNNAGVDHLVENLKKRRYRGKIGVSIGKNEDTPIEKAVDDYLECLNKVYGHCDYITINVSCPNTKDLASLQEAERLDALLKALKRAQGENASKTGRYVPLAVKIAPDLDFEGLKAVCDCVMQNKADAICCTNTTTDRDVIYGMEHAQEKGGLSGQPLREKSTQVLSMVSGYVKGRVPLIGIGGVNGVMSAKEKLSHGAGLVQIFTALVYEGPKIIPEIVRNL